SSTIFRGEVLQRVFHTVGQVYIEMKGVVLFQLRHLTRLPTPLVRIGIFIIIIIIISLTTSTAGQRHLPCSTS
ncbi:hypothetical protein ACTFP8_25610, partial [Escherichia coli]|uniref:hypothetical protein n=1 Tax=Escherichia coli TaxID=562 RepID=UPI003F7681D7